MSDLIQNGLSLSDYLISNQTPGPEENETQLSKYLDSSSKPIYDPLNYTDPELKKFMHTPTVTNQLQISEDYDKTAAELATSYMMAQKLGIEVSKVIENYPEYSRHFFGDDEPVGNWQHIKDAFTEGEIGTKMGLLSVEYIKKPYSPEGEKKYLAELAQLEMKMPPAYDDRGNVLMKAATGSASQIYRQVKSAEYLSPIPDIQRRLAEKDTAVAGLLSGMNDYITGYDSDKDRTAYITKWQASLGSFAVGQGITLANALYYSELETGSTYIALSRIKTADTIGEDGEIIPGVGLDEDTKRALAQIAGPIKGLSEAYLERLGAKFIPGVNKLFGSANFLTNTITDAAVKMGVKGALLKALQAAGTLEMGEIATEIFQGSIDISANNLSIELEANSHLFEDDKIGIKEAAEIGIETLVETFWTVAPTAFFGGSFTGIVDIINQDDYRKKDIANIIRDNILISATSEKGFSTKDTQELIKNDPRMFKYSDKGIEQAASSVIISEELGIELNKDPEFTLEKFLAMQRENNLKEFTDRELTKFKPGTPEFETMFQEFVKNKILTEQTETEEDLRAIYEKTHTGETKIITSVDVNGDTWSEEVPVDPKLTFAQFKVIRRNTMAYVDSWRSLNDSQKYFETMQPSVQVIRSMLENDIPPQARINLEKAQAKIESLVNEAIEGSRVASLADFKTETDMEVKVLEDRITELQRLGSQYVNVKHQWKNTIEDKAALAAINRKLIDLHKVKYEIENMFGAVEHILGTVSSAIYNKRRIGESLESIDERLIKRIDDYNSQEMIDFYNGVTPKEEAFEKIKTAIEESLKFAEDEGVQDILEGIDVGDIVEKSINEVAYNSSQERLRLEKQLQKVLPDVDREQIDGLILLLQYRAYAEQMDLQDFTEQWFKSKMFRVEGPNTGAQAAFYPNGDQKSFMAFKPDSSLKVAIHEFGHMFQMTLLPHDKDILDNFLIDETYFRLERSIAEIQKTVLALEYQEKPLTAKEIKYTENSIGLIKEYKQILKDFDNDNWTTDYARAMNETFAHTFQEYAQTAQTKHNFLKEIFNKFAQFLRDTVGDYSAKYTGMEGRLTDEIVDLLDRNFVETYDNKLLHKKEELTVGDRVSTNIKILESNYTLYKTAETRYQIKAFDRMLIGKMQKALSNKLKVEGEILIKSINGNVPSTVSLTAKDKIETIQKAVKLVDEAIDERDIAAARDFVNKELYPVDDKSEFGRSANDRNYIFTSERVAEILMQDFRITFDANATGIRPKFSLDQLIDIQTEINLLEYIGKLELSELNKNNLINKEVRKSQFLMHQKETFNKSKKDKKLFGGLNFSSMSAHDWANDLFGKYGIEMFYTNKNNADNNARLEKNKRTKQVLADTNMSEKDIIKMMFEEKEYNGVMYPVQKLMYYYLGHTDQNIYNSLASVRANKIDLDLLGNPNEKMNDAGKLLTEKEREVAHILQQDLQNAWQRTAAVFEASPEGIRLGQLGFYLPKPGYDVEHVLLEDELFDEQIRGNDYKVEGVDKTMTLERKETPKDTNIEIQDDLWDIWQNYIHKQEHYIAHTQWVRDARQFIADPEIKNTIKENYNPHWVEGINTYIDHIANPTSMHGAKGYDNIVRKLKNNTAISALWGRSSIWARQLPSLMMYLSKAGANEFKSAIVQYNGAYYFEGPHLRNHIIDMIMDIDPTSIDTKVGYDLLHDKQAKTKAGKTIRKVQEAGMKPIYAIDRNVKATGWLALYNKNYDELGPDKAIEIARDYTTLYQPSGDKTTLPGMYTHNEFMSLALMFTQQPTKIFNYTRREVLPNLNPLAKDADRLKGIYAATAVLSMNAAIWMISQRKVPDDPLEWLLASTIGSVSTIPGAGKIISDKLQGTNRFSQTTINKVVSGLFNAADLNKWKDTDSIAKQVKSLSSTAGVFGFMSEFTNDVIDLGVTGDPWHLFLGGELGEK